MIRLIQTTCLHSMKFAAEGYGVRKGQSDSTLKSLSRSITNNSLTICDEKRKSASQAEKQSKCGNHL